MLHAYDSSQICACFVQGCYGQGIISSEAVIAQPVAAKLDTLLISALTGSTLQAMQPKSRLKLFM